MNTLKLRRILILIHLYLASILAPVFILVAVTGALKLARIDPAVQSSPIELPATATLDFQSPSLEDDIREVLDDAGVRIKFEYIRSRGNSAMTRPTSQSFVQFDNTPDGLTASLKNPNLHYRLMELHKGHGPTAFRYYQILAGISLLLVVLGGLTVGVMAKAYRRPTLLAFAGGSALFLTLAFLM